MFTQVLRNLRREVTRKLAAQFEAWRLRRTMPSLQKPVGFSLAPVTRRRSLSTVLMSGKRERSLSLPRKFFQTLCPNYSDEIAQFVFDVAGHSDGVGDLLAQ